VNITDVSYTSVTGNKTEEAQQNISLPASGKSLSVENGGNLTLVAGNSINLKPGFHAKAGSKFTAKLDTKNINGNMEIPVPTVYWVFYENYMYMCVQNANSYSLSIENSSGVTVYQSAGVINSNYVDLWEGTSVLDTYTCFLHLRNNYGRIGGYTFQVKSKNYPKQTEVDVSEYVDCQEVELFVDDTEENIFSEEADVVIKKALPINTVEKNSFLTEADVIVYPNPSGGTVQIAIAKPFANYNLKMYNTTGVLVYESKNIVQPTYSFDISAFADGTYTIQLDIDNQRIVKKLMLAK
jgi:hypothetical protein